MADSANARLPRELEVSSEKMANKWKIWRQSFEFYAIATQLANKPVEVQAATFMSAIGTAAMVIFNTFELTIEQQKDLTIIKQKFDDYFAPTLNETYTRYLFFTTIQMEHETFDTYLTSIRTKIVDCAFGMLQDSLLRDQIVRGVKSDKVRELLLAERDLTLSKAMDICRASEQATKQLKEMLAVTDNKEKEVLVIQKAKPRMQIKREVSPTAMKKTNRINRGCNRCGLMHDYNSCPAYGVLCNNCKQKGHYARKCQAKRNNKQLRQNYKIHETEESGDSDEQCSTYRCDTLHIGELIKLDNQPRKARNAWFTQVQFEGGTTARFKLDTGAEGDVVTLDVAKKLAVPLVKSGVRRLKSFNNEYTPVIGELIANCMIQGKLAKLRLIVVDGKFNCVLGCYTCERLGLVKRTQEVVKMEEVQVDISQDIYRGIGCIKNFEYDIKLQEGAALAIHPPRRIPYAIRDQVKSELDDMVKKDILIPVTHPTPAVSPLVIVKKSDRVRLCLDPTDVNKAIKRQHFPLKTVEDIAARIGSANYFTLLDAKKGFWQLKVTPRTSDYLTVNTPWGRYSFLRVPFGLASAPEVFQQVMQSILEDCEKTECSMDDVLIWADTREELKTLTDRVMKKLWDSGVRLNKDKCVLGTSRVKFLGHLFTPEGVEIDSDRVKAIEKIKTPTCVQELQRFLGMVNYTAKFIPAHSKLSEPLRRLLQKEIVWEWSEEQQRAFQALKDALRDTPKLAFYDVNKPVVVSVDASSHAVGAVLLQEGRPIAYATRALTPAQTRYPQIEKEAFAIRFGCQKFHNYIYGKSVLIETDHKPLEAIAKKPLQLAPPRLQRILFDVLPYMPRIVYKRGKEIPIPDALSRDCTPDLLDSVEGLDLLEVVLDVPIPHITIQELLAAVDEDLDLQLLKTIIVEGWPGDIGRLPPQIRPYWNFREELAVYEGLLFKSERLLVPQGLRSQYLKLIHHGHLGIALSLRFARELVFWLGMARDIESSVQQCSVCQQTARATNVEPLIMKPVPRFPWQRIASDLFMFAGSTYCLVTDSYSGYFDFRKLKDPTSKAVVAYLKELFSVHGIPDILESDNGPQYASEYFGSFLRSWKIKHYTSSPYYPQANGLAERYVQIAKLLLKRCLLDGSDYHLALLNWRNTPRRDLPSPAQRLFGRPTKTLIPLHPHRRISPDSSVAAELQSVRQRQKVAADSGHRIESPVLEAGQAVKLMTAPRSWVPARVSADLEPPRSYLITTADGKTYRRNSCVIRPTRAALSPALQVAVGPPRPVEVPLPSHGPENPGMVTNQGQTTRSGRPVRAPVRLNL